MTKSSTPFSSSVGRRTGIAAGLALLAIGTPVLLMGIVAVFRISPSDFDAFLLGFVAILLVVGFFCVSTALRMILGRSRRDGGLFSPFVLRTAGVLFAIVPVLLVFAEWPNLRSLWTLLEVGFFLAVAGSCFALASKRQHPVLGDDVTDSDE